MIRTNIRILELLCQEKDEIEAQINSLLYNKIEEIDSSIENIRTIPGVSDKTISAVLGECGDIKRFSSAKAFIAYLGLYPTQYQSGNSLSVGLYMAAVAAVRHNIELNKVFYDKVSAGKSKKEALIIISKKLATIIYSLFKYNKPYEPKRVFVPRR